MTIETTEMVSNLPFPSHVKTPAPNVETHALSGDVVATMQDLNDVLTSAGNVHKLVRAHYVNLADGIYGIERLIASILQNHCIAMGCNETGTFPSGVEKTEFRSIAIAGGMFASDVIATVREVFGADRYPDPVIKTYLAHHMQKDKSQNKTGSIQLSTLEDKGRPCPKPRTKYYLLTAPKAEATLMPA